MTEGLIPDIITPLETVFVGEAAKKVAKPTPPASTPTASHRSIITLGSGQVTIDYPEKLTSADVDDLHSYLEVFIKQLHRKAKGEK